MKSKDLKKLIEFRRTISKEAQKLARYGLWEEAEITNLKVIERLPSDYDAYTRLGDALLKLGNNRDADDAYQVSQSLKKYKEDKTRDAVRTAMDSLWIEAVRINRMIVEDFPWELESHNRLGKSLLETGDNSKGAEAFQCALVLSPNNPIAKKNLARLQNLSSMNPTKQSKKNAVSKNFIEDSGKTGMTRLVNISNSSDFSKLIPGHPVQLVVTSKSVKVRYQDSEDVGTLDPKIGSRIRKLMDGGNKYEASITSVEGNAITVMIRETYRHPSQARVSSFPRKSEDVSNATFNRSGYRLGEMENLFDIKDWSDDDVESGDEDVVSPDIPKLLSQGSPTNTDHY